MQMNQCDPVILLRSIMCLCCVWEQDWLRAENLLPHQTVEKLTKRTVYDDGGQARTVPAHNGRGPWESEDPTQEMLESRLVSTQVLILHSEKVKCKVSLRLVLLTPFCHWIDCAVHIYSPPMY